MTTTIKDVLTKLLVEANYPEVKREGFINSFYEYLFMKLLIELEENEPEIYNKFVETHDGKNITESELKDVLAEVYANPQLKEKIDKVVADVTKELAENVNKFATDSQRKNILGTPAPAQVS